MPRKEKPADPLLQVALPSSGDVIPAMAAPSTGHNSFDPIVELARAGKLLEIIDIKIAALNAQKSAVYAELGALGFKKPAIKAALAARKIDPVVAAETRRINEL